MALKSKTVRHLDELNNSKLTPAVVSRLVEMNWVFLAAIALLPEAIAGITTRGSQKVEADVTGLGELVAE